jgi:hypothetical protein
MASRLAQNAGIGNVEISLYNLTTTVAGTLSVPVTQADLDAGRDAVCLAANNRVGLNATTAAFFGKAVAVSEDVTAKGWPKQVTVQVAGVMTVNGTTTLPTIASFISCLSGKVAACSGTTVRGTLGAKRLAQVIDVWDTDKIDVIL